MILTNARSGKRFFIAPQFIGSLEERISDKEAHANTKTALIKLDGNFVPVAEDIDTCMQMLAREQRAVAPTTQQRPTANSRPPMTDDELGSFEVR